MNSTEYNDCILWKGRIDKDGYGRSGSKGAHRVAYEEAGGTLIKGLEIDHLCRNRACVNPNHLEQVTHKVNTLRGNTITAKFKATTHCPAGHEYSKDNTYVSPKRSRHCRSCNLNAVNAYRKRLKQL